MVSNIKSVKKIYRPSIKIDSLGPKRIFENIFKKNHIKANLTRKKLTFSNRKFIKINELSINKYLEARNLLVNRSNSMNLKKIDKLDHYIWWMTSRKFINALIKNGANEVYVFISHGVLSGDAAKKIKNSKIKKLIITDSIDNSNKIKNNNKIEV